MYDNRGSKSVYDRVYGIVYEQYTDKVANCFCRGMLSHEEKIHLKS